MGDVMALRFVGQEGQFLPGIPARDLTADEAARWPVTADSPLYAPADREQTAAAPLRSRRSRKTSPAPAEGGQAVSEEAGRE